MVRNTFDILLYKVLSKIRPIELAQIIRHMVGVGRRELFVDGRCLWIDPLSQSGAALLSTGKYEPELTRVIGEVLCAGDNFLDISANEGWFSLLASALVGDGGQVIAIEPQERCWPVILRNLVLNRGFNCRLLPCAIGACETEVTIGLYPSLNGEASSLVPSRRSTFFPRQKTTVATLDSILKSLGLREIKLAKIDCEGYEFEAVKGAGTSLQQKAIEYLIIEYHPKQLAALGQSRDEVEAYLNSMDYRRVGSENVNLYRATG